MRAPTLAPHTVLTTPARQWAVLTTPAPPGTQTHTHTPTPNPIAHRRKSP